MTQFDEGGKRMDREKRKRLEAAGWAVGSTAEFLGLPSEEMVYIEVRARLSDALRERRAQRGISQSTLAARIGSSQSRVSKMEVGDAGVTLDLLIRSLIAIGVSLPELARIVGIDEVATTPVAGEGYARLDSIHFKANAKEADAAVSFTT